MSNSVSSRQAGGPRHQRPTNLQKFLFGCPYYPEHWTAADREHDAQWMAAAGVNVVRMAEFAWDRIEPRRGYFDFSLFDETIERLGRQGISTIMCTPTATPPRWLTSGHGDWFRVDENSKRMDHGSRQHCCTTNEAFRAQSRRITQEMATHYAGNPHVIGWQTDNEFFCHMTACYCPACQRGFRDWLRDKYKTVDALNLAWGNAFWALTYDDFAQIPLPYGNFNRPCFPNPSQELDYYRFLSDAVSEFQRQQVQILRKAKPAWFVTHNGMFARIDYWKFTQDLDFLGFDIYPTFVVHKPADSVLPSISLDKARASSGGFIVPEQQAGSGGQKTYLLATPAPGQMRLWAYQSIAHGADGVLHFRWRSCRFGAEEYWGGVIDHDNIRRRRYDEFAQEGTELKRIGEKILHSTVHVQAGVLFETDQDDAYATYPNALPSPGDQATRAYRELWRRQLPGGMIAAQDSFEGLRLLVCPSLPLMDEQLAGKLAAFVREGGVLIATARTACKDRNNQVLAITQPGPLAEVFGATVQESGKIDAGAYAMAMTEGEPLASGPYYEILATQAASALATWQVPPAVGPTSAAGQPAVSANRYGKGLAIYVGTYMTDANERQIMDWALAHANLEPLGQAAEAVEMVRRRKNGVSLMFVLNHRPDKQVVKLTRGGTDLLTGRAVDGEVEMEPYGVAVIEENSKS